MDPPGNMEDVIKIARAFTYDDPDGNGLYDTVGLGVVDRLFFSIGDLKGFFNGYHTYPDRWIKDENGQLVPGFIMPEMKLPLLKLREMYKDGLIDKEFAVKDYPKLIEEIADGKIGMLYGEWWLPNWPLQMNLDKDPNADWKCYTLPSNDTEPAKTVIKRVVIEKYNVAFKGCKHPEALIKMLNLAYEMENSKECEEKYGKNANKPEGGYVYNWVPVRVNRIFSISKSLSDINKALRIKDPSNLDVGDFEKYNIAQAYLSGDKSKWGFYYANVDENGGFGKIVEMLRQERVIYDEYTGYPNPVIFENEKILYDEMIETFTSIIMGGSIDEYDKFVNKWRELGGDKVIKEVNEWYVQRN